jgi:hypothetical protein
MMGDECKMKKGRVEKTKRRRDERTERLAAAVTSDV